MSAETAQPGGPLTEIDRLIHEPARYNIMALLYVVDRAEFLFVQNQTGLTAGNLSAHTAKLEAAGYVEVTKRFVGKKPKTLLALSSQGRTAFEQYRKKMAQVLSEMPSPPDHSARTDEV